ncbi:UDP-3-O-(3-hydroxymyristoyl)glucosamine N-acyltransferase [Tepidamorphus sp. 3E244]|uniref:UDP-3-O-(3-hydroxymyristoyl)glucosamine N-acyltransferase n=1 Tax=Tepidamorphus sp. 3E244 TaxID=3385498 RepID=UPI0038FCDA0D
MPFYKPTGPHTLAKLAETIDAERVRGDAGLELSDVASLDNAGAGDISFFANTAYLEDLKASSAGAVITKQRFADQVPDGIAVLVSANPAESFEALVRLFYPQASKPLAVWDDAGISERSHVHPTAELEDGVIVEPGAVIGPRAQVGSGTRVMASAVIGADVRVGRDGSIGPNSNVTHAFLGDRVILHPGVCIGQDGFGYSPGPSGIEKAHQVGRVIIQNDVEIGAGTCIDRGAVRDTMIGEGTKIDNLVQIAHNCVVGRFCIIVSKVALAGSVTLGDGVMIGGDSSVNNHVTICSGARITALSAVQNDITEPGDYGGVPVLPVRQWFRELFTLQRMVRERIEAEKRGVSSATKETDR